MENLFIFLVVLFGVIGFLSPCTWNLNAILIANVRQKGKINLFYFFFFRTFLFTSLGGIVYFIGDSLKINLDIKALIIISFLISIVFFFGNPTMKKFKIAPFDLSVQGLFPKINIPPGVAIGLNFPYCAFPFFILIESYGIYLGGIYPLLFAFLFSITSGIPTFISYFLSKESFKKINDFIPAIPYISGFIVLLTTLYIINQSIFSQFSLFDFVNSDHSFIIAVVVSFLLGVITSSGPSTLPFLPVIGGMLITNVNSKLEIMRNVFAFTAAFIISHIIIAVVAFYGFFVINKLFNVQVFNFILGVFLIFLGLNFIGIVNLKITLPKIKAFNFQKNTFIGAFILGFVYTFSICPSCTGFLLGAVALSVATKNLFLAVLVMVSYAVGRSFIVFLLGFLFNVKPVYQFFTKNYIPVKKSAGVLFIILAFYFISKSNLF